ncbi:hypothetical protein GOODEAATRI_031488 [Goodea atripinnis]|uniref:Uncharacterized protein n=1 Tax=Goodea atripinnis TaxID=208336 RepID=A0ABV0NPW1_9TELE
MTLSDPVEELCLFASKETLARWVSLSRSLCDLRRRDRTIGKVGVLNGQWHHGKSAVTPPFPNVGSRLIAIYFESSRKVCTASFMLQSMAVGPNMTLSCFVSFNRFIFLIGHCWCKPPANSSCETKDWVPVRLGLVSDRLCS